MNTIVVCIGHSGKMTTSGDSYKLGILFIFIIFCLNEKYLFSSLQIKMSIFAAISIYILTNGFNLKWSCNFERYDRHDIHGLCSISNNFDLLQLVKSKN